MNDLVLVKIDRVLCLLAEVKTAQEANQVIALANAATVYAKQVGASTETINRASEIRLRAERRLGEVLRENPKNQGARPGKTGSKGKPVLDETPTLAASGISKKLSSRAQELAAAPVAKFEAALRTPPNKELNHNRVVKDLKESRQKEARKEQRTVAAKGVTLDSRIIVGDFREHADKVADGSLSLIFTDPPYDREASKMLPALGEFAESKLADGGSLICYVGQTQLPAAIHALCQHLRYWWTIACVHGGRSTVMREYGINAGWKAVLWFVKRTRDDTSIMVNDVMSGGEEKTHHEWQQSQSEAAYWIGKICPADGIVCDPFLGSGTTATAAKSLKRKWVGFEIDGDTAAAASRRIAG